MYGLTDYRFGLDAQQLIIKPVVGRDSIVVREMPFTATFRLYLSPGRIESFFVIRAEIIYGMIPES